MAIDLTGRQLEQDKIISLFESDEAEFLAIYGRRRVGKTYLVRKTFERLNCIYLEITGQRNATLKKQLTNFTEKLQEVFYPEIKLEPVESWREAFKQLTRAIERVNNRKVVVFLDELPWLASRKSGLLSELDYFWNTEWVKINNMKLIVCGSAVSWMIKNIVSDKGGLHNRITDCWPLTPFTLKESAQYLKDRGVTLIAEQILQIYMVTGGIPYYLRLVAKGKSAVQNISQLCFLKSGLLYSEFDRLFDSLFASAEIYKELISIIASKRYGIMQTEILKLSNLSTSGGAFKRRLRELEEAGFILSSKPIGRKKKGEYYRIIDEYSLFYLTWILPVKGQLLFDKPNNYWEQQFQTSSWKAWSGYTFETICFKHLTSIKKALGVDHLVIAAYPWRYIPGENDKSQVGAQIDLVIDRSDDTMMLCEMKYNAQPLVISKVLAENLEAKRKIFKAVSKTNKHIFMVIVSCAGVKKNEYSAGYINHQVGLEDLFHE